ncbi:PAS domain S-box protein [Pelagibacterium xiamenense]|uniref:PAS domain S-box protein n=1 Tax=Pelagibacterium xiamenense TaxID=2901140 RepID=UPI001E2F45E6|nr:PAS domain S-box protein [Pelagibacterium xiamenense]MCD7059723.1 PAS domain S-box protein [Pelagibacterium xiamenense]
MSAPDPPRRFSLEAMPVPMVFATHRIIREVNPAFAALFGYEAEELAGQSFNILYPRLADFVMVGDLWRANFSGGRSYTDERIMRRRDGSEFWCHVRGRSMIEADPFSEAIYCFDAMTRPVLEAHYALTDRQRQILSLISQGKTSAVIAGELGLSRRSIDTHRLRLMRMLGVSNTAEMVAWFTGHPAP